MATEYRLLTPQEVINKDYIQDVSCVELVGPEKWTHIVVMWKSDAGPVSVELRVQHPADRRQNPEGQSGLINITLDELLTAMQMLAADQKARGLSE